jgi:hypothetical protein
MKVDALKYLKVVLFRRSEGTKNNKHLARGVVQSTGRGRRTADGRIGLLNRLRCWFC